MQLSAEHLTIERGGRAIVRDLSFAVAPGRALVLTGANGAGKTTLLRAVGGFLPLAAGRLTLDGSDADTPIGEYCHVLGHSNGLRPQMTVAENIAFWASYLGEAGPSAADVAARTERAMSAFALEPLADFQVAELSAGQKRRTGLARLIAAERPLWLLDEPTSSLDTAASDLLVAAVNAHLDAGGLAIIATHLPLAISAADTLCLTRTAEKAPAA